MHRARDASFSRNQSFSSWFPAATMGRGELEEWEFRVVCTRRIAQNEVSTMLALGGPFGGFKVPSPYG